jgi:hypothetical protein
MQDVHDILSVSIGEEGEATLEDALNASFESM